MAESNRSEAYDFSLFEPRQAKQAPKKKEYKTPPKPHLVKEKPKTAQELRAEAISRTLSVLKVMAVSFVMIAMIGSLIQSRIKLTEISKSQVAAETRLAQSKSETVRLKMALDSKESPDKVENYAQNKLGMIKTERYQMYYINLSKGDEILYYKGKTGK